MLSIIKYWLQHHKYVLIPFVAVLVILMLGIIGHKRYKVRHKKKPVVMTTEMVTSPTELVETAGLTPKDAVEVRKRIITQEKKPVKPVETYKASSLKDISYIEKENKADKTIISARKEDPFEGGKDADVKVYRINLEKTFKVKAGVTYLHDELYKSLAIEKGNLEATMHFQGSDIKGASVMYTIYKK